MASYVDAALKSAVRQAYANLQDTFDRSITVYKNAEIIKIAVDPDYNALYSIGVTESVSYEEIKQTFSARIIYERLTEKTLGDEELLQQAKINMPDGWIRIIVDPDGFDFIKEAVKVEVDGRRYKIKSDGKPRGLFEPQFYEFTLTPLDEGE